MSGKLLMAAGVAVTVGLLIGHLSFADDKDELSNEIIEVRKEGAHHLLLPRDWPVVKRNGVLMPVGVEEYLSMKFSQVHRKLKESNERIEDIEERLNRLEKDRRILQSRIELLEKHIQDKGGGPLLPSASHTKKERYP